MFARFFPRTASRQIASTHQPRHVTNFPPGGEEINAGGTQPEIKDIAHKKIKPKKKKRPEGIRAEQPYTKGSVGDPDRYWSDRNNGRGAWAPPDRMDWNKYNSDRANGRGRFGR